MSTLLQTTNLAAAIIYVLVAFFVAREVRRLGIGTPPLIVVLLTYFSVRVVDLLAAPDPLLGYSPVADAATDIALIALLLYLLLRAKRVAHIAIATVDEARLRVAEYERARHDYSVAVHAKVAGPLSVLVGAAQSLEVNNDDPDARDRLTDVIVDSAAVLRAVTEEFAAARASSRDPDSAGTLPPTAVSTSPEVPADDPGR